MLYSQNWCPPGAEWNYRYYVGDEGNGYINYKYTIDTVISGINCKMLKKTRYTESQFGPPQSWQHYTATEPSCFTYQSGDTVFFYSRTSNSWQPMYYFGAQIGDTIRVLYRYNLYRNDDESLTTAFVTEVGTDTINNEYKRYYRVIFPACSPMDSMRFVESLGTNNNDLIPNLECYIPESSAFLCSYSDSSFNLYPENAVCRFILNDVETLTKKEFSIYPNPASATFTVNFPKALLGSIITISNLAGEVVSTYTPTQPNLTIPIDSYKQGVYIVAILIHSGYSKYQRLVIIR